MNGPAMKRKSLIVNETDVETVRNAMMSSAYTSYQRKRCLAIYGLMVNKDSTLKTICRMGCSSANSLRRWVNVYNETGLEGLLSFNYVGKSSSLYPKREQIIASFKERPPKTTAEARERIHEITGIYRCPTQVRDFMHKNKLKYRKMGAHHGDG